MTEPVGYQCQFCKTWFLLRERFDAHRMAEISAVVAFSEARAAVYAAERRAKRANFEVYLRDRPLPGSPVTPGDGA